MATTIAPPPRMKETFENAVKTRMEKDFGITNPMQLPTLDKIVINVGMGRELEGTKLRAAAKEQTIATLRAISGQAPVMLRAKKSVANFKVREGYETAAMVTMRRTRMWEFLDRLYTLAIPRIKDFRGLPEKSFDAAGNYSFGITEQGIFPEVDMANVSYIHGMNIQLIFKNSDPAKSKACLEEIGFPLKRPEDDR